MISHPKVIHASAAEVLVFVFRRFCLSNFRAAKFVLHVRLEYDVSVCSAEAVIFAGLIM